MLKLVSFQTGLQDCINRLGLCTLTTKTNLRYTFQRFRGGAPHIIVSDVKPATFGYSEGSHWQDVLRGQERCNYRDFQQEIRNGGVGFAVRLDS